MKMVLIKNSGIARVYDLDYIAEYLNGLDDKERQSHLFTIVGTLIYRCLKRHEFGLGMCKIFAGLKNTGKFDIENKRNEKW